MSGVAIIAIFIVIGIIANIYDFIVTRRQALERVEFLEKNNNELSAKYYQLSQKYQELENAIESAQIIVQKAKEKANSILKEADSKVNSMMNEAKKEAAFIVKISEDKINAIPYLAEIYADFVKAKATAIEDHLRTKKNPAYTAAENVAELRNILAREAKARKVAEYNLTVKSHYEEDALLKAKEILDNANKEAESIKKEAESIKKSAVVFERIAKEKLQAIPWLADAYAKLKSDITEARAEALINKKRPAYSAAIEIRSVKKELAAAIKAQKTAEYMVLYYQSLLPDLEDTIDESPPAPVSETELDTDAKDDDGLWLSKEEYDRLSINERAQLAFERYKKKHRSKWEIGRDFERYIGYRYERDGFKVTYQGIIKGFEDLGRDLICEKRGQIDIVQCKYWSSKKVIHEKHINQLFGTVVEYAAQKDGAQRSIFPVWQTIEDYNIRPVFITSTQLSPTAKKFAKILNVDVRETSLSENIQ
jgi:hypothetical protein